LGPGSEMREKERKFFYFGAGGCGGSFRPYEKICPGSKCLAGRQKKPGAGDWKNKYRKFVEKGPTKPTVPRFSFLSQKERGGDNPKHSISGPAITSIGQKEENNLNTRVDRELAKEASTKNSLKKGHFLTDQETYWKEI